LQVLFDMLLVIGVQAAGHIRPRQVDVAKGRHVTVREGSEADAHVEHYAAAQVVAQEIRRIRVREQHSRKGRPHQ